MVNKTNYPVGDFLIRVKNASRVGNKSVVVSKSNMIKGVADALKRLGFVSEVNDKDGNIEVRLAIRNKVSVITNIKLISRPGLRVYEDVDWLEAYRGPSTFILSTPQGILTSREAIKKNAGGEIIAELL